MSKKQAYNPYLPFWETIPDAEPHVFGKRLYVYGSHDQIDGGSFCTEDYVCWSAPIDDLADWRCEGVIYRKDQDPINGAPYEGTMPVFKTAPWDVPGKHCLYAPDVAQGPDGRYYLYYALDGTGVLSVAVCNTPAGKYEFLDFVRYEDGSPLEKGQQFDPAIYCDETGNYLYYGFTPVEPQPGYEDLENKGAMMVRLADDMHTVITHPVCVANGVTSAKGTPYEEHPFFEASSLRKIKDHYYFVYSSLQGHELCYGMADTPKGPFEYKGVITSQADIGYKGNTLAANYYGNNHGGLVEINGNYYIFWHRQTHGTCFSRQGCADKVEISEDGTIPQIEITSCGLNGGPLNAKGTYPAYIACQVTEADQSKVGRVLYWLEEKDRVPVPENWPYITEEEDINGDHCLKPMIANLKTGAAAGFKYFRFDGTEKELAAELRGHGTMVLHLDAPTGTKAAEVRVAEDRWTFCTGKLEKVSGEHALFFVVEEGCVDFSEFEIR